MSSEPLVETHALGKAYPIYRRPEDRLKQLLWGGRRRFYEEFWAVRNVDLSVRRGETVAIIGPNGSGKSTLLQMICGTSRPSEGEVKLRGRVAAMLALGSGFNPEFTGRENVHVGASVLGLSAAEIAGRFDAIVAFADLGPFLDQPLKRYSSGMHARLAFAVCANVDADILVIDEILSVGDAAFQQKCMRYLNRFRLHGTLLFVSHDSGAVVKLCDRALWLDQGSVRGFGEAKEMSRLYLAAQAEEKADGSGFRIGGRNSSTGTRPVRIDPSPPAAGQNPVESAGDLMFDAEDPPAAEGGADIESAAFHDAGGAKLQVAAGGERIELRIVCRARRAIADVVVAFVLRDRLGQAIFSDDTACLCRQERPPGQSFAAKFRFFLPYLASGPYAVEAFVFERKKESYALLHHQLDNRFLYIQSPHPSNGLANVAMRSVSLKVVKPRACERPRPHSAEAKSWAGVAR